MTERQRLLAAAIGRCRMLPGSNEKRFARDMAHRASTDIAEPLSDKQSDYLEITAFRYRRQLANQRQQGWDVPKPVALLDDQGDRGR